MCLGKPGVDTTQMTVRESLAEGGQGNPAQHFQPSPSPPPSLPPHLRLSLPPPCPSSPPPPAFFLPFDCHVRPQVPARLSAMKNIIQPVRLSNGFEGGRSGGWGCVWGEALCQTGAAWKQRNPLLHISAAAACWQSAAKSPHMRSTVSSPKS